MHSHGKISTRRPKGVQRGVMPRRNYLRLKEATRQREIKEELLTECFRCETWYYSDCTECLDEHSHEYES